MATITSTHNISNHKQTHDEDNAGENSSVKKFDFSVPVGVSYEFNNLVLEARYNVGLTEVIADSKAKNSVFQLSLGYKFGL